MLAQLALCASAFVLTGPAAPPRSCSNVAIRAAPRLEEAAALVPDVDGECEIIGEELATSTTWFTCTGDASPGADADCESGEGFGNGVGMPRDDQKLCKVKPWWRKVVDKVKGSE